MTKRYVAVATEGAMTRSMSAAPLAAASSMPGRSEKTDSPAVVSVSQNFVQTHRCLARPHGVPSASTRPLRREPRATGTTSQSPKTFMARVAA
ncbi:hypothetical protein AMK10_26970 [Streptomyces sp. CB02058]|nr:hypothetical protein AMK10_26970 [Streptomyces sp. CB02058]